MAYLFSQDQYTIWLLKSQTGRENPPIFLTKNRNLKGRKQALFGLDKDIKDRTDRWEQSGKNTGFVGEISWK